MAIGHEREDGATRTASSRRRLLTRGAGALAAVLTAEALARPAPAAAANGNPVILGQANTQTAPTQISDSTGGDIVLECSATGGGVALYATTAQGDAISGNSDSGRGVDGVSNSGNGVEGFTGTGSAGVFGLNGGTGNGVQGNVNNAAASGVYGQNAGTGFGVAGRAASGVGVLGDSANGVGVWASSQNATALKVTGSAQFTGSTQFSRSGVATVAGTAAAPQNSVRVSLPITAKSMMTALLQQRAAGVYVAAAVPNVAGGYFTIYLNKAVTVSVGPIAWIVTEMP